MIATLLAGIGGLTGAGGIVALPFIGPIFAFFGTAFGRITGIILIALAIYAFGWFKGDAHGDAQCAAKDLAMQLAAAKRDADIQKSTAALASKQAEEQEQLNQKLNKQIAQLEKDYDDAKRKAENKPAPAGAACPGRGLSDDDIKRLRNIGR